MSAFLGFESLLIPLGSTVQNVLDQFRTSMTGYGWQCVRKSVFPVATLGNIGTVANAFDGNPAGASASSNAALPLWIGAQMATPFTPTVLWLQTYTNGTYAAANFTLDYSDNGSTWTVHQTWTGEPAAIKYGDKRKYIVTGASAHAYWRVNVTARTGGAYIEFAEVAFEDAAGNYVTNGGFIDLIPPVTETIGNSFCRDVLRLSATTNTIGLRPLQELLSPVPQIDAFYGVAGAVTASITINGVTVSFVGTASNTAYQNARGLYEAIKNSNDPNFLAFNWYWVNYSYHFIATKKVPSYNFTLTSSNITKYTLGGHSSPQPQSHGHGSLQTVTTDLTNGFIYYLQVNARGISIATKTNVGYYGPLHACYGDNTSALSQTPATNFPIPDVPCTPIELLVGINDTSTNTGGTCKFSHVWGVSNGGSNGPANNLTDSYTNAHPFTGHIYYGNIQDFCGEGISALHNEVGWVCRSEGLFSGGDSGGSYRVHRVACDPDTQWNDVINVGSIYCRGAGPVFNNLDWYRITGSLTDEQLLIIPHTDASTVLVGNVNATDTTINVVSTNGFLSAGYIIVEDEIIQYTNITATTFTGCTRGKYDSLGTGQAHFDGAKINIGAWFVKINTGLVFAGYTKPS